MTDNTPQREPSADLRHLASVLRQTYIALTNEGFSEAQALSIIAGMLAKNGGSG